MNEKLILMLKTSAEADKAKALLTLDLLGNKGVGIGDHSTEDYYKNAEEALAALAEADDKLETLNRYEFKLESGEYVVIKDGKRQ